MKHFVILVICIFIITGCTNSDKPLNKITHQYKIFIDCKQQIPEPSDRIENQNDTTRFEFENDSIAYSHAALLMLIHRSMNDFKDTVTNHFSKNKKIFPDSGKKFTVLNFRDSNILNYLPKKFVDSVNQQLINNLTHMRKETKAEIAHLDSQFKHKAQKNN